MKKSINNKKQKLPSALQRNLQRRKNVTKNDQPSKDVLSSLVRDEDPVY